MATYATVADLETYIGRDIDGAEGERVLGFAERDVDRILRQRGARVEATGLKFDPDDLGEHEATALMRATCAQAEYRLAKGEEFFVHAQHTRVGGPDFTTEGRLPYIGPKVRQELSGMGLTGGRVVSATLVSPYSRNLVRDDDLPWPAS